MAFDTPKTYEVMQKSLTSKLPSSGFSPLFCTLNPSFLFDKSILVDGLTSPSFPITSNASQGSVLSPTSFYPFINDLSTINWIHSTTIHTLLPLYVNLPL